MIFKFWPSGKMEDTAERFWNPLEICLHVMRIHVSIASRRMTEAGLPPAENEVGKVRRPGRTGEAGSGETAIPTSLFSSGRAKGIRPIDR